MTRSNTTTSEAATPYLNLYHLTPACDGLERPFTVKGVQWLYCWDKKQKRHCYWNIDTGDVNYNREFHPAFHPELPDDGGADWLHILRFF